MNYKNTFLELCQQHKVAFPKLNTQIVDGTGHEPRWQSQLECKNGVMKGELAKTKIIAEQSLYKKLLDTSYIEVLKEQITDTVEESTDKKKFLLIVDIENYGKIPALENHKLIDILGICSRNFSGKVAFKLLRVDSLARDAADVAIMMYTTILIQNTEYEKILLLTRDLFGHTFAELSRDKLFNFKTEVIHCVSVEEVQTFLK